MRATRPKRKRLTSQTIAAMTPAERQQLVDELENETPEQRAAKYTAKITPAERKMLDRLARRMGRPKLGKNGTRAVCVTVEADLLDRAESYARSIGMKRSRLFSEGLRRFLAEVGS